MTSAGCAWTATSNASWLTITSGGSGSGPGNVGFSAAAMTGGPRSGTLTVGGQTFTVNQGNGCAFSISPTSTNIAASGGNSSFEVAAGAGCAWTATSSDAWLTITSGATGSGGGTVQFAAASTNGGSRSATITVADQTFTVNQGGGCSFSIAPTSTSVAAGGGNGTVAVTAGNGCDWTATSNASWLSVTSGANGSGNGTVRFTAASTNGGSRSGTITIAGQTFTVNQGSGCSFSLPQSSANAAAGGGTGSVGVTAAGGCSWTAASNVPWLTITAGGSGSGNGTVQYSVASNAGSARSGTLTIGGQTFTVNQASGCSFSLSQSSANAAAGGGTGSVAVTAGGGCSWTAASNASWLTVTSGGSGSGNGTVQYSAAANPGGARSGTLTIAGHTFTVNQASGCSISISATSANVSEDGIKNASVTVTAGGGCAWTAVSNVPWIDITSGASDTGNGSVRYSVDATTGPARSGTMTIGGHTFTVNQASGCTYQVSPATFNNVPALGATRSVTVTTAAGCTWTTTPHVSWITVTTGASGNGNGTVTLAIAANLIGSRSGTVTVAGQTVTVNQLGVIGLDPAPELAARTQERSADSGYPDRVQETEHGSAGRQGEQRR